MILYLLRSSQNTGPGGHRGDFRIPMMWSALGLYINQYFSSAGLMAPMTVYVINSDNKLYNKDGILCMWYQFQGTINSCRAKQGLANIERVNIL